MRIGIVFSLVAVLLLVASCCTQRTAHSLYATNSVEKAHIVRDSVFVLDSVILRERSDTVFLTRTRTLYRDRVHTDTLWRSDTVFCVKERVVTQKSRGAGYFYLFLLLAALFLLSKCKNLFK